MFHDTTSGAHGLALASYREIVPRLEHGKEVPGQLFVFESASSRQATEL